MRAVTATPKTTGLCKAGMHRECTGSLHRLAGGGPCGCSCHSDKWTALRVREEMPDVMVLDERTGQTLKAKLSGRLNRFATVMVYDHPWSGEFAWETIADCLNRGVPLRA
jgi:hypothetical protein